MHSRYSAVFCLFFRIEEKDKLRQPIFRSFLILLILGYIVVSTGEGFLHRHYAGEDEQDCSYCHWDHTGAVGTCEPAPMVAAVFVVSASTPLPRPIFHSISIQVPTARGPPLFS